MPKADGYLKKGHDPRRHPGGAPGSGRKPDEFKEMCRRLASGEATAKRVMKILGDENHPQFMAALKWATEQGYGKATQSVEHSGKIHHGVVMLPALGEGTR